MPLDAFEILSNGYLDVADDIAFNNHHDACNLFGHDYKLYLDPVAKHPFEPDKFIWFAKFFDNAVWENTFLENEDVVLERRKINNSAYVDEALANRTKYKRLLFAKLIEAKGKQVYRFKGYYELDAKESRKRDLILYRRKSRRVRTYPNKEYEALLANSSTSDSTKYFTHYWQNPTWETNRLSTPEGTLLSHIAGEQFGARGIEMGDVGYVVTNRNGKLFLCGKMIVGTICTKAEAAELTGLNQEDLYDASQQIIGSEGTPMKWDLEVPLAITKRLEFIQKKVISQLKFDSNGLLDKQTLRPIRMLTSNSAALLDTLLISPEPINTFQEKYRRLWEVPSLDDPETPLPDFESQVEGNKKLRFVAYYERSPENRKEAIRIHGYDCKGCDTNFEKKYGLLGKDFIHVHHLKPVSQYEKPKKIDPAADLTVLCPNCHAMVHRLRTKTLSVKELRDLIDKTKGAI